MPAKSGQNKISFGRTEQNKLAVTVKPRIAEKHFLENALLYITVGLDLRGAFCYNEQKRKRSGYGL